MAYCRRTNCCTLNEGTYPAQRWEELGVTSLYYLPDEGRSYFVEMDIDDGWGQAMVLRSFVSNEAASGLCG